MLHLLPTLNTPLMLTVRVVAVVVTAMGGSNHHVFGLRGTTIPVVYHKLKATNGPREGYVIDANGTNLVRLTHDNGTELCTAPNRVGTTNGTPDWSPDGSKIAFLKSRTQASAIFTMKADGSGQTALTQSEGYVPIDLAWSPDGSKIVFGTNRANGLWIIDA
jgi:Tol biopolymer transport system component